MLSLSVKYYACWNVLYIYLNICNAYLGVRTVKKSQLIVYKYWTIIDLKKLRIDNIFCLVIRHIVFVETQYIFALYIYVLQERDNWYCIISDLYFLQNIDDRKTDLFENVWSIFFVGTAIDKNRFTYYFNADLRKMCIKNI